MGCTPCTGSCPSASLIPHLEQLCPRKSVGVQDLGEISALISVLPGPGGCWDCQGQAERAELSREEVAPALPSLWSLLHLPAPGAAPTLSSPFPSRAPYREQLWIISQAQQSRALVGSKGNLSQGQNLPSPNAPCVSKEISSPQDYQEHLMQIGCIPLFFKTPNNLCISFYYFSAPLGRMSSYFLFPLHTECFSFLWGGSFYY